MYAFLPPLALSARVKLRANHDMTSPNVITTNLFSEIKAGLDVTRTTGGSRWARGDLNARPTGVSDHSYEPVAVVGFP